MVTSREYESEFREFLYRECRDGRSGRVLDDREGTLLGRGATGVVDDSTRKVETSIPFPRKKDKGSASLRVCCL